MSKKRVIGKPVDPERSAAMMGNTNAKGAARRVLGLGLYRGLSGGKSDIENAKAVLDKIKRDKKTVMGALKRTIKGK